MMGLLTVSFVKRRTLYVTIRRRPAELGPAATAIDAVLEAIARASPAANGGATVSAPPAGEGVPAPLPKASGAGP